ncbi:MAG: HNH endonuclease, partial [Pedobacter agri]
FSASQSLIIKMKLDDKDFSFLNWKDEDLKELRKSIRDFYRKEQKAICSYCKNPVSLQSASNCHIEHIVPKSKYRYYIFEPKNLCVICADCNEIKREQETIGEVIDPLIKGGKRVLYPRSSRSFKIVHPHFDEYDNHILILNSAFYLDKTPKGNFTIYACRLNRRLYAFGWEKETVDDAELMSVMTSYLNEKSITNRVKILNQLKKLLIQT